MQSPDLNLAIDNLQKLGLTNRLELRVSVLNGAAPTAMSVTHTAKSDEKNELRRADEDIADAVRPALPKKWFLDSTDWGEVKIRGKRAFQRTYLWMAPVKRASNTGDLRQDLIDAYET